MAHEKTQSIEIDGKIYLTPTVGPKAGQLIEGPFDTEAQAKAAAVARSRAGEGPQLPNPGARDFSFPGGGTQIQTAPGFVEDVAGAFKSIPERFEQNQENPLFSGLTDFQRELSSSMASTPQELQAGVLPSFGPNAANAIVAGSETGSGTISELLGAVAGQVPDSGGAVLERGARAVGNLMGVEDIMPIGGAIKFAPKIHNAFQAFGNAAALGKTVKRDARELKKLQGFMSRLSSDSPLAFDVMDITNRMTPNVRVQVLPDLDMNMAAFATTTPTHRRPAGAGLLGVPPGQVPTTVDIPESILQNKIPANVELTRAPVGSQFTGLSRSGNQVGGFDFQIPATIGHEFGHVITLPGMDEVISNPRNMTRIWRMIDGLPQANKNIIALNGAHGSVGATAEGMGHLIEFGINLEQQAKNSSLGRPALAMLSEIKAMVAGMKDAMGKSGLLFPKAPNIGAGLDTVDAFMRSGGSISAGRAATSTNVTRQFEGLVDKGTLDIPGTPANLKPEFINPNKVMPRANPNKVMPRATPTNAALARKRIEEIIKGSK